MTDPHIDYDVYAEQRLDGLKISKPEKDHLRALASTLAQIAADPKQAEKINLWRRHNALEQTRPLVFALPENAWNEILDEQVERIGNEERKARLEFVRPAVSADPEVRDRFFTSLSKLENRAKERWVLEALNYLHHPLRVSQSEKYILPSLQLLGEIKKTGDIFFPKAWLDATLGGYNSESAAETVRAFLLDCDYGPRLVGKLQQSADGLFRAASLVESDE